MSLNEDGMGWDQFQAVLLVLASGLVHRPLCVFSPYVLAQKTLWSCCHGYRVHESAQIWG